MKFRIVNLWKRENHCSDFFGIDILAIGRVDVQYYLVILNFSFIVEIY